MQGLFLDFVLGGGGGQEFTVQILRETIYEKKLLTKKGQVAQPPSSALILQIMTLYYKKEQTIYLGEIAHPCPHSEINKP